MKSKGEKSHRARKNPGSAEFFRKQRKATTTARPKQRFVQDSAGGHWERP